MHCHVLFLSLQQQESRYPMQTTDPCPLQNPVQGWLIPGGAKGGAAMPAIPSATSATTKPDANRAPTDGIRKMPMRRNPRQFVGIHRRYLECSPYQVVILLIHGTLCVGFRTAEPLVATCCGVSRLGSRLTCSYPPCNDLHRKRSSEGLY